MGGGGGGGLGVGEGDGGPCILRMMLPFFQQSDNTLH